VPTVNPGLGPRWPSRWCYVARLHAGGVPIAALAWQNGRMTRRTVAEEKVPSGVAATDEAALIARLSERRQAGQDTSAEFDALVDIAIENNRGALDRLAQ